MNRRERILKRIGQTWKKTFQMNVRLDEDADARLELMARRWQCSRGEVVRRLIKQVS